MIEQITDYVIDNVSAIWACTWQHMSIAMFLLTFGLRFSYVTVDSANQPENRAYAVRPQQIKFEVTEHAFLDVTK